MKLIYANKINGVEIDGIVDVSVSPPKLFCMTENEETAYIILNAFENNKAHENRIRVLSNLNAKYREKLGLSNEPVDLGLLTDLGYE